MAIAIAVHAVLEDVPGQHLHHADLARPGAGGGGRIEVTPLVELHRGEDLRPEDLGAAAVMRQRDQRVQRVEIPLESTVIGLEGPERQQHPARDAVIALDPVEDLVPALRQLAPPVEPVLADQLARELDEWRLEDALRPVAAQHAAVLPRPGQEAPRHLGVVAHRHGLVPQPRLEGLEVTAAGHLLRESRTGERKGDETGERAHVNLVSAFGGTVPARFGGARSGIPLMFAFRSHSLRVR